MGGARFALSSWSADSGGPHRSQEVDEAGEWYSALRYGDPAGMTRVVVATVPRRPGKRTSERGGIAPTIIEDAMRVAVTAALDLAMTVPAEQGIVRSSIRDVLDEASTQRSWRSSTLTVDDSRTPCHVFDVLDVAWAAVVEYPDVFLSVAALRNTPPDQTAIERLS